MIVHRRIPHRWRPWVVTLSAGLFFTYDFIQLNIFNSIGQAVGQEFGLSATALGALAGVYLTAQTLAMFISGYLLDRCPTRQLILSGMGLCVLATFASAMTHSVEGLMWARACAGITGAFCFLSALLLASSWFASERMSTVVGILVTMGMLGGILAQAPMDWGVRVGGWRFAMWINASVGLCVWLWMWVILKRGPLRRGLTKHYDIIASLRSVLTQPQNWWAAWYTAFLNSLLFILGAVWGNQFLTLVHHLSQQEASWVVTQLFVGTMIGAPAWGYWVDRTHRRREAMLLGAGLSCVGVCVLFTVVNLNFWEWSALFFFLGLSTSTQVLSYPHVVRYNVPEYVGMAESFTALCILGLGAIGQPWMGWLMDMQRVARGETALHYVAMDFHMVAWVFPVFMLLAFLCAMAIKTHYVRS